MATPDPGDSVRIISAVIDVIFAEIRIKLLADLRDALYEVASREIALAETLFEAHKNLREKDSDYFELINSFPIRDQKYACALATAATTSGRKWGRALRRNIKQIGMYSAGERRDVIETSMAGVVDEMSGNMITLYRNQDELHDKTYFAHWKHRVESINRSALFIATDAMRSVGATLENLSVVTANSATGYLSSAATSFGVLQGERDSPEHKSLNDTSGRVGLDNRGSFQIPTGGNNIGNTLDQRNSARISQINTQPKKSEKKTLNFDENSL